MSTENTDQQTDQNEQPKKVYLPAANGIYFIEIKSGDTRATEKILIAH